MPDEGAFGSGDVGSFLVVGLVIAAIIVIGVIVKQRSGASRTAMTTFLITAALVLIGAMIAVDQYNIAAAEGCYTRMLDPLPNRIRGESGYYLEVRGDGTAWCKCHGEKTDVEAYLRAKYASPVAGTIARLRRGLVPPTPTHDQP